MNFFATLFRGSRSIRQRLFWMLGILSLGTLSIVNLIWLPSSITEIRQSQAELQRVAVRSVGEQIELFLHERERQLKSQAVLLSAPFAENNREAVRLIAHRLLQRDPAFEEIGIVDREGKERFRLARKLVVTDQELRDLSVTPIYQEGMRGKLFFGSVFTTETYEPLVTLAVPLQASETATIGVMFGVLSLKSLWDLTGEFKLTYGGRAYIVEKTGRVIAADDSSLVLRQLSYADRPLIRQLTQSQSSAAYSFVQDGHVNENKVSVTATGIFLPGPGWAVVVEQSQALLYSPVRQKLWLSLGISFIGLMVSFGLARSLSRRLSGPIIRLREGVKLIGRGQLKHRVVVEGADEVGELAVHFNAMAESLEEQEARQKQAEERTQRQLEQITALREIGLSTTSTLDRESVLKLLMEKIAILLPYTAALVWLLNKETGQLERTACWNLDEAEWKGRKLAGTPSLVKLAIESKAPVVASRVQTDPRAGDGEFFRRNRLVSYLGVPLLVRGDVLGVLSFLTREGHEFTPEETGFLSTVASQAAIAIDNAQLYEQTRRQAVELATSNKVKDEFLSVMSHELRTPLNVILGYTTMLKDGLMGDVNSEQEQALAKVVSRTRDQLTMINGILQATQMEADKIQPAVREVPLAEFLDDLRVGYELPLNTETTVRWDYPTDLPALKTDGEKLKHVLQNLINNALKFTAKGSVTVSVRLLEGSRQKAEGRSEDGNTDPASASCLMPPASTPWVEFRVKDTGIGIPKEQMPIIFEKFHQVDSSETRLYGGVGIGLYIVKQFTELLGGKVEVESELGKGSTFAVSIPCAPRFNLGSGAPLSPAQSIEA